jgi:hypothetical protein
MHRQRTNLPASRAAARHSWLLGAKPYRARSEMDRRGVGDWADDRSGAFRAQLMSALRSGRPSHHSGIGRGHAQMDVERRPGRRHRQCIEMVFIPEPGRTLCIQPGGCALDCSFCATAGRIQSQLTAAEIGQVWLANRELVIRVKSASSRTS